MMDSHLGPRMGNREDIFVSCSSFPLVVTFHVAVKYSPMEKGVGVVPRFALPCQLYANLLVPKKLYPTVV